MGLVWTNQDGDELFLPLILRKLGSVDILRLIF